jgi:threo-3-hydroxy-L-aspartate ammonia-lyase
VSGPTADLVRLEDVRAAHARIAPYVMRSPLVPMTPSGVWLKAESLQPTGAFKLRGAFNCMLQLSADQRACGVVAHSSGNHAIAVAHAGAVLGIRTVIVMPHDAPVVKIDRTRALGAEVVLVGGASSERVARADELVSEHGYRLIEPYNSLDVMAATGTITVELLEQAADQGVRVAEIYVPISGGGLAGGVAVAAKRLDASIRVVGVEPEVAADALASRRAGHVVTLPPDQMALTIADGLRVQQVGSLTWPHIEAFVDDIVTVSEDEIRSAMRRIALESRLVAEPSGATPVAAALAGRNGAAEPVPTDRRMAILCGGNVDLALCAQILADR